MKNLLVLGAVALLLFSMSAALSLWLNQSRQETAQAEKDADKGKAAPPKAAPPSETAKDGEKPPTIPKPAPPAVGTPEAGVLDQQARLERKAQQISLVLADVQSQRESTDLLLKQVTAELKNAAKEPAPAPGPKPDDEVRRAERANLQKLATIYDAMSPEGGGAGLKKFAESGPGKMEQAAQILVLMQQRKSAQLLEAMNDPDLVAQLMDKVRQLRTQTTAPPPAAAPTAPPVPTLVPGAGGPRTP